MSDLDTNSFFEVAIKAPSSHNTQPWLSKVAGTEIQLFADRIRCLPVNDPHDCALAISCGCALMNLRVAIPSQYLGSELAFDENPDHDLLATIWGTSTRLQSLSRLNIISRRPLVP